MSINFTRQRIALIAVSFFACIAGPAQAQRHPANPAVIAYSSAQAKKMILESDLFLKHDNIIRLCDHSGKKINMQSSCFSYDARKLIIDLSELSKGNYVLLIYKKDGKIVCSTEFTKA